MKPKFNIGDPVRFGNLTGIVVGMTKSPRQFEDDEADAFYWDVMLGPYGRTYRVTLTRGQYLSAKIIEVYESDLEAVDD